MRGSSFTALFCVFGAGCSGSAEAAGGAAADGADTCGTTTEILPLTEIGEAPGGAQTAPTSSVVEDGAEGSPYVTFIDCATGFRSDEVHDADREIVRFDSELSAMVSATSGDSIAGWMVAGADLDWSRSAVAFRVRFGTEEGERRAYFTEAGPGTICNLTVAGPDVLFISATNETPPNP